MPDVCLPTCLILCFGGFLYASCKWYLEAATCTAVCYVLSGAPACSAVTVMLCCLSWFCCAKLYFIKFADISDSVPHVFFTVHRTFLLRHSLSSPCVSSTFDNSRHGCEDEMKWLSRQMCVLQGMHWMTESPHSKQNAWRIGDIKHTYYIWSWEACCTLLKNTNQST